MHLEQARIGGRSNSVERPGIAAAATEEALNVVIVFQGALTRHWATELWDRVGQVIGSGGICRKTWKLSDLTRAFVFAEAVHAAAEADVLLISIRDAGELPTLLYVWVDAWLPRRAGRAGALAAVIGVPANPDALAGRAHAYLESVAREAGMDYLPQERRLPEGSRTDDAPLKTFPATNLAEPWPGVGPGYGGSARLRWGLSQ